jgi:Flagellin and related hook-associated proteins
MRINHNISALNTYNKLSANTAATSKSLEKLSSGLKINRAGDNAAGLAISEKMRGQIRGLDQASSNANDGISLIQTAEGALNETHSILQRMRELAVQSSNDTNTDTDRAEIQKEVEQLKSEVTRISTNTEFNTKKLLNGDMGFKINSTSNTAELKQLKATGENLADGAYSIAMTASGTDTIAMGGNSIASTGVVGDYTLTAGAEIDYGTYTLKATNVTGTDTTLELYNPDGKLVKAQDGVALDANLADFGGLAFDFSAHNIDSEGTLQIKVDNTTANVTVTDPSASTSATGVMGTGLAASGGKVSIGGFEFKLQTNHGADATTNALTLTNKAATFQIGANEDQNTKLNINAMGSSDLGIDAVDLSTQAGANSAITTIDDAISLVSSERAKLGAVQNRLDHTINNLGTSSENLTSAESRIRDVDMAKEMMDFTKNNILSQAAQSMLAQANQQPQGVLQLLQ